MIRDDRARIFDFAGDPNCPHCQHLNTLYHDEHGNVLAVQCEKCARIYFPKPPPRCFSVDSPKKDRPMHDHQKGFARALGNLTELLASYMLYYQLKDVARSPIIMEAGGIRKLGPDGFSGDGHSTLAFLRWAQDWRQIYNGQPQIWTIDPDPQVAVHNAALVPLFRPRPMHFTVTAPAELFLSGLDRFAASGLMSRISLLFLDAGDVGQEGVGKLNLRIFEQALDFTPHFVLVDDVDYPDNGKASAILGSEGIEWMCRGRNVEYMVVWREHGMLMLERV